MPPSVLVRSMERLLELGGAAATSRWARVDGGRVHWLEAGAGRPVLLLHGAGGGGANWFRVIGPLARRLRVLAPDLPGFGLSEPISPMAPLGGQVADWVRRWLDVIAVGTCDVVGTSFGGLVALRLAQRAPDRVRRIVLLDSAGLGPEVPAIVRIAGTRPVARWLRRPSRGATACLFRKLLVSDRGAIDPTVEAALIEYLLRSAEAGDPVRMVRAYRLFCGIRGQREILRDEELRRITHPALVVWGDRDRFFPPAHGERAAATLPLASIHWVRGAGHSPSWEAPDRVATTLARFLGPEGPTP